MMPDDLLPMMPDDFAWVTTLLTKTLPLMHFLLLKAYKAHKDSKLSKRTLSDIVYS